MTAKITITVVRVYLMATSMLTLVYNNWLLKKIKIPYNKELA
jgi:hypothetical protein